MKRFLTLLIIILLFIIAVVISLKNQQLISVNYLLAQSEMHLSTLLAITFMIGFTIAGLFMSWLYLRLRVKNKLLRRANNKQRKELDKLHLSATIEKD